MIKRVSNVILTAIVILSTTTLVRATSYYWDTNGVTSGAGGPSPSGAWNGTNPFWNPSADGSGTPIAAPSITDDLTFCAGSDATGSYTVTLAGSPRANSLIFKDGSAILSGVALTLSSSASISNVVNATISSVVTGAVTSLVKSGNGTLTLSGANTYAGATTVNGGKLVLNSGAGSYVYNGGVISINNGSILQVTGSRYDFTGKSFVFDATGGNTLDTSSGLNFVSWAPGNTFMTSGGARNSIIGTSGMNINSGVTNTFNVVRGTEAADLAVSSIWNSGGILKTGNGIMMLTSSNTYSGPTVVNAGTLVLGPGGALANSTPVTVAAGAVLDVSSVSNYTVLVNRTIGGMGMVTGSVAVSAGGIVGANSSVDGLTFANDLSFAAGATNYFDFSAAGAASDRITVNGNLAGNSGKIYLNMLNPLSPVTNGSYTLLTYGGSLVSGFDPAVLPASRRTMMLDQSGNRIAVTVSGSYSNLTWMPGATADWDLGTSNWVFTGTATADRYYDWDTVTFDDNGAYSNVVTLTTTVRPTALTVNSSSNYMFAGSGKVSGITGFTKSGVGTLTVATLNDCTNVVQINGGVISVGTLANGGVASGIGAGTNSAGALVLNGGGLQYSGGNVTINRMLTVNAPGGVIDVTNSASTLTINGGGWLVNGTLTKRGPGTLQFTGYSGSTAGAATDFVVEQGTLSFNSNYDWGYSPIGGDSSVNIIVTNGATLYSYYGAFGGLPWPSSGAIGQVKVTEYSAWVIGGGFRSFVNGGTPLVLQGGTANAPGGSYFYPIYGTTIQTLASAVTSTNNITVSSYAGGQTVTFNVADGAADPDLYNTGNLSAGSVTTWNKNGAGRMVFAGSASANLNVNAGTVSLTTNASVTSPSITLAAGTTFDVSALSSYTIVANGSLQAAGSILGSIGVGASNVVIRPAGPVSISSNLTLNASTTNYFDIGGLPADDVITVGGALTPNGSAISVNLTGPLSTGTHHLFNAGANATGFNAAVPGNTMRKGWSLVETATTVDLDVSGSNASLVWQPGSLNAQWDLKSTTNWLNTGTAGADLFFTGDDLLFNDSGAVSNTVTLVGTVMPTSLAVNSASNYTFTGSGLIGGTSGLTKDGTGTLTMNNANTCLGDIAINAGTLMIGGAGVVGGGAYAGAITDNGNFIVGSSANQTLSGPISGSGALVKNGTGALTLTGSNTYSGVTVVNQGAMTVAGTTGPIILGNVIFDNNLSPDLYTTVANQFGPGVTITFTNDMVDHGRLELIGTTQTVAGVQTVGYSTQRGVIQNREFGPSNTGTGTLVLDGSDNYTFGGYLRDSTGKIQISKIGTGTQTFVGTVIDYTGPTAIQSGRLVFKDLDDNMSVGFAISSNAVWEVSPTVRTTQLKGRATISGAGTWLKSGTNTLFVGNNGAGITVVMSPGSLIDIQQGLARNEYGTQNNWTNNQSSLNVAAGAKFNVWDGNTFVNGLTGEGIVDSQYAGYGLTVGVAGGSSTFDGVLASSAGALNVTKVGGGILTLTGTNTMKGALAVNGGVLVLGATGSVSNSATISVASGALIDASAVAGGFPLWNGQTLTGGGIVTGSVVAVTGATLVPGGLGVTNTLTFANDLTLNGNVTNIFELAEPGVAGGGTNDLINVAGSLVSSDAVIVVNSINPLTNGTYRLFTYGGTFTGSFKLGSLVRGWSIDTNTTGEINLSVSANGANIKWQAGTNANWDRAATTNWFNNDAVSADLYFDFDNVLFDDSGAYSNTVTLAAAVMPGSVTVNSASNYTFAGAGRIVGTCGLTKAGAGTLTLACSGGNSFTGGVVVAGGTFKLGTGTPLAQNTSTIISNGAAFDFNGQSSGTGRNYSFTVAGAGPGGVGAIFNSGADVAGNASVSNLVMTADTTLGATGRWDVGSGAAGALFNGGGFNLTKVGTGEFDLRPQYLTNLNSVTIQAGRVKYEGYSRNDANTVAMTNTVQSAATLASYGALTFNLPVVMNGGTLSSDNSAATWNGNFLLNSNAAVTTAGGNITINGVVSGPGGWTKVGANTLYLTAANTYTGTNYLNGGAVSVGTIIDGSPCGIGLANALSFNGGTLQYTGAGSVTTSKIVTNVGAGTFDITTSGTALTLVNSISGAGAMIKAGNGTLIWSNNLVTASGGLTVRQGPLLMNGAVYTNTTANQEFIGNGSGDNARLVLSNNSQIVKSGNNWVQIGSAAGATGVVVMVDGILKNTSTGTSAGILMGNLAGSVGAFYQLGGAISGAGSEFTPGYGTASSYGYYLNAGGSLTNAGWIQMGRNGLGVMYQSGGNIVPTVNGLIIGNNGTGVVYQTGGTLSGSLPVYMQYTASANYRGELSIAGNGLVAIANNLIMSQAASGNSIVNLDGGTLQVNRVVKNVTNSVSRLNFNGGTLKANISTNAFMQGLDSVYVYGGGAMVDDNGQNITIAQPLLTPEGSSGVSSISTGGTLSGYVGAPYVGISGGGGTGATAVAQFDYASGTVTGVVVTCAGFGYTSAPTVTLVGGGKVNSVLAGATIAANAGGGLTKAGAGTLTLTGTNTFSGPVTLSNGVLRLTASNTLTATNAVVLNGGSLSAGDALTSLGALTVNAAGGTILLGTNTLQFANSSSNTWSGPVSLVGPLGSSALRFGTSRSGLTPGQLLLMTSSGRKVLIDDQGFISLPRGMLILVE